MRKVSTKHHVLGRPIVELEARKNLHSDLSLLVSSIPIVAPLVSPLLDNGNGGSTQPSSPPGPQPAPGNGEGGNGNGGGGNGGGNGGGGNGGGGGGGNPPTPTTSPTSSVVPLVSIPGTVSPGIVPGNPPGSSSPSDTSNGGSSGSGGQTLPVNVASGLSITTSAALGMPTPVALVTGSLSPSQHSLSSGSDTLGTVTPLQTISTDAAVSSGKQLSGGAIAGITLVCLFFLFSLVLLVVRRRSIARRVELRRQWWFGRSSSGRNVSPANSGAPLGSSMEAPGSRLSARSSFATNFDQGLMFRIDSPSGFSLGVVPSLPPMAEVRDRNSALISTGGAVARRESMNSMLSNGSNPDAQYLAVSTHQNNLESSSPMSVRPFSPSESFAFPKPPAPPSSNVDSFPISETQGFSSPQSSATTLVHLSTPPRALMTDLPPAPVPTSLHPQISTPDVTLPPRIAANQSIDPFADPAEREFSDVGVIRRPFAPSLDDELAVHPGDRTRLLRIFDDGWAFVQKLGGTEGGRHERGLVPVDCFREVDQALPAFLAEKRVNCGSDQLIAVAL